jgi:hypothetical protein
VIDCLDRSVFTKDWTALDELKLLDGIDKFGLGNWKLISDSIGKKSARACDEHYWDHYLGRYGRCLPVSTFVGDLAVPTADLLAGAAARLAPDLKTEKKGEGEGMSDEELKVALLQRQTQLVNLPPPEVTASLCSEVDSAVQRFKGEQRRGEEEQDAYLTGFVSYLLIMC